MLNKTQREERARSIRRHLLDYMKPGRDVGNVNSSGVPRELAAACLELNMLMKLEQRTQGGVSNGTSD